MGQMRSQTKDKENILPKILIGSAAALGITVAGAALMAAMVIGEKMTLESISVGKWMLLFLASLCGTLLGTKLVHGQALPVGGAVCAVYLLILAGINILFFDGAFCGVLGSVLASIAGCAVSVAAAVMGKGRNGRRRKSYSR